MKKIIPVILCGGSGTRLWPLSRLETPKQFLKLMDDFTLLQRTAKRTLDILGGDGSDVVTVTLRSLRDETVRQLQQVSPALARNILSEPQARNTAAAVALAIQYVRDRMGPDCLVWILPADHFIGDERALKNAVQSARLTALENYLVTFGIEPTRPETGYGYIHRGANVNDCGACAVGAFIEKPAMDVAQKLLSSGEYLWSSGMHMFHVKAGQENFLRFAPQTWEIVRNAMRESGNPQSPSAMTYGIVREEPFETAILEKADRVAVIPCDPRWSDIGCWESLWELREKDASGNALDGNVLCQDTSNSMILAQDRLVTCVGLKDIIVIETGDSILVADKNSNGSLKALVKTLQNMNREEVIFNRKDGKKPSQGTMYGG